MASDKSLAAEIEAVTERHRLVVWLSRCGFVTDRSDAREAVADALMADFIAPRLAEIAALQSRAFEDGARGPFRVVRRVPRNVYRGDALVFIAATEHEAAEMVALLNAGRAALAEQEKGDA